MTSEMIAMGAGAVLTVMVSLCASQRDYARHVDTMSCAAVLLLIWVYAASMAEMFPAPTPPPYLPGPTSWIDPFIDGLGAAFVGWRMFTMPSRWKFGLFGLLLASVLGSVAFNAWVIAHGGTTYGVVNTAALTENVLYWLALAMIVTGALIDAPILARLGGVFRRHRGPRLVH